MSFTIGTFSGSQVPDDAEAPKSPSFTPVEDLAPVLHAEQMAVTSVGTNAQSSLDAFAAAVNTHQADSPFTITWFRPVSYKSRPPVNPNTGVLRGNIPTNTHKIIVRKGVNVHDSVTPQIMTIRVSLEIPAGAESADEENVRAAYSALAGFLSSKSIDNQDSLLTGLS